MLSEVRGLKRKVAVASRMTDQNVNMVLTATGMIKYLDGNFHTWFSVSNSTLIYLNRRLHDFKMKYVLSM